MLKEKIYFFTIKEKINIILKNYVMVFLILFVYYRNIYLSLTLAALSFLKYRKCKEKIIQNRKQKILYQFKEYLHSYLVSLSSGDFCEKGILSCHKDLQKVYKEADYIMIYLNEIIRKQKMGINICVALEELAREMGIEEIITFTNAFIICYKSGGDMLSLLRNNIQILENKFEIKEKVKEIFSEKKYEMKIITIMPCMMVLILNFSADEYMRIFYADVKGSFIMTIAMLLNFIGFEIADRITEKYE